MHVADYKVLSFPANEGYYVFSRPLSGMPMYLELFLISCIYTGILLLDSLLASCHTTIIYTIFMSGPDVRVCPWFW
jgi:hypothetical protein